MSKIAKFFDVYGMKCHSCKTTVEHEINQLSGISSVHTNHKNSMVIVTYDNKLCNDIEIINAIKIVPFQIKITYY